MPMLDTFDPAKRHSLMFVGKNGAGKTIAALQFPGKTLWLNLDGKINIAYQWFRVHDPARLKDVDYRYFKPNEYEKMAEVMEKVQMRCEYDNIILDPLTFFGDMLINYSMAFRKANTGTSKGRLLISDPDDYKVENQGVMTAIRIGQVVRANFILICHIYEDIYYPLGEDKPRITRKIMTAGKVVAGKAPGLFDEVWLFKTQASGVLGAGSSAKYLVNTRPSTDYEMLYTSCPKIKSEIDWTGKNLYNLVEKDLAQSVKREVELITDVTEVPDPPEEVTHSLADVAEDAKS